MNSAWSKEPDSHHQVNCDRGYCGEEVQENTPMNPKFDPLNQLPYFCPKEKRWLLEKETVLDNFAIGTYSY